MVAAEAFPSAHRFFPFEHSGFKASQLRRRFQQAFPFPFIHFEEFLDRSIAIELAREFPNVDDASWNHYRHYNENKMGLTIRSLFPPLLGTVIDQLQSQRFISWLEDITGIQGLMSDMTMEGGGLHQIAPGGHLNVHADFTRHHRMPEWRRRLNLLVYLNEDWKDEWNGHIELWDKQMSSCVKKFPPVLNHALLFATDADSFHGHPEPLRCPEGITRKSIALYYFTHDESNYPSRATNYQARPQDGINKRALVWVDKKAVSAYSRMKKSLRIPDEQLCKLLNKVARRR
jgi:hypothetical protein